MVPLQARRCPRLLSAAHLAARARGWGSASLFCGPGPLRQAVVSQRLAPVAARRKNSSTPLLESTAAAEAGATAAERKQPRGRKKKQPIDAGVSAPPPTEQEPFSPRELAQAVPAMISSDSNSSSGDDGSDSGGSGAFPLRGYQQEAVARVLEAWRVGQNHQLVSMPTGTGKTVVFASLIRHICESAAAARPSAPPPRALVLVHRAELLAQAESLLGLVWPAGGVTVLSQNRKDAGGQVVIATVQTALHHLPVLAAAGFVMAVVDEAHHTVARSWGRVLEAAGFLKALPHNSRTEHAPGDQGKLLLGFTATAYRRSPVESRALMSVYGPPVYALPLPAAVRAGALAPVVNERVVTQEDLSRVGLKNGDFTVGQLSEICNSPGRNALVVETWRRLAGPGGSTAGPGGSGRKTIVFAVDRAHGTALTEAFQKAGVSVGFVDGMTSAAKRQEVLSSFKAGVLQVLVNVSILTEGFDEPSVSAVFMARPTRSTGLYTQMVGRGLRRFPEKQDCLVVDFTDSGERHNIAQVVDWRMVLEADSPPRPGGTADNDKTAKVGDPSPWAPASIMPAGFVWLRSGEHFMCSLFDKSRLWLVRQPVRPVRALPAGKEEGESAEGDKEHEAAGAAAADAAGTADVDVDAATAEEAAAEEEGEEEEEGAGASSEIRPDDGMYLPLRQPFGEDDPSHWTHIAGAHVPKGGVSLAWAQGLAEDWVASHLSLRSTHKHMRADARWRSQPATPGQLKSVTWLAGRAAADGVWGRELSKGDAAAIIDGMLQAPATEAQRAELESLDVTWEEPLLARRAAALIKAARCGGNADDKSDGEGEGEGEEGEGSGGRARRAAAVPKAAPWIKWQPEDIALTEKQLAFLRRTAPRRPWMVERSLGPGLVSEEDWERALSGLSKRAASKLISMLIPSKGGSGSGSSGPPRPRRRL